MRLATLQWRPHAARAALALSALSVACGGNAGTAPPSTGTLSITIAAPTGVTASVTVTGPAGFGQKLSASQVLTGVATGAYMISADLVVTPDPLVGTRSDTASISPSSVTVSGGGTSSSSVVYALEARNGVLWVANYGNVGLNAYAANQLRSTMLSVEPVPVDSIRKLSLPSSLGVDQSGNVWVGRLQSDTIAMYTSAQLAAGGQSPSRILIDQTIAGVSGLRFDAHENMWLMVDGALHAFAPAQLVAGGMQSASIVISGGGLVGPNDVAFDANGDAWVSDETASLVLEYSPSELSATGSPSPVDTIDLSIVANQPTGLALDATGNLWVAITGFNWVIEFTAAQLAAGGTPTPAVIDKLGNNTTPLSIAFDNAGDLWVAEFNANQAAELTPATLAGGGFATPTILVSVAPTGNGVTAVLFDPSLAVSGPGIGTARYRGPDVPSPTAAARSRR